VSTWPIVVIAVAFALIALATALRGLAPKILLPLATAAIFVAAWHIAAEMMTYSVKQPGGGLRWVRVFPTPWETMLENRQPLFDGTLARYTIASVYRVAVGFGIAAGIGIPLGLCIGWFTRGAQSLNPLMQFLRPISPIAWIPLAILWFGIHDSAAIFLIAYSSFFPIVTGTMTAVRGIPVVYVRSAQNFGLEGFELFRRVVFPATMPQIITSLRLALGIAWLVIVAAEMCGIEAGLGYQILDSRNANNYERVIGAMIVIGVIGVCLDFLVRRLERFDEVRWGFPNERSEMDDWRFHTEMAKQRAKLLQIGNG
jgi:NitT/TauT family transport system permease protein